MPVLLEPGRRAPGEHVLDLRRVRRDARPVRGVQARGDGADRDAATSTCSRLGVAHVGVSVLCPGAVRTNFGTSARNRPAVGGAGRCARDEAEQASAERFDQLSRCSGPPRRGGGDGARRDQVEAVLHPHVGQPERAVLRRGEEIVRAGRRRPPVPLRVDFAESWPSLMSTVPPSSSTASTPPIAKQVPDRAHPPRRHGHRPVRLARRPQGPRGHRVPGGGERLHRGADRRARRAAIRGLRRDQGAHPGDRPVGAGAQGELVAVRRTVEGQQYAIHCRRLVARRRGHPAGAGGRQAAGRRGGAARRERARGRGQGVLLARRAVGQSPTSSCSPTPPTSPATSGTRCGSRTWRPARCCPTRCPTPTTAAPGRLTGRPCSTSPSTRRGGPYRVWRHVVGTPDGRRRRGVRGEPTRSSGSASAPARDEKWLGDPAPRPS